MATATFPKPIRILLVEDDEACAAFFERALRALFLVERSSTYAEGREKLILNTPPIQGMVLDLGLPNGLGLAMIRSFRMAFPKVALLVCTGLPEIGAEEVIEAGAQEFLAKPFTSPAELCDKMKLALARLKVERDFSGADKALEKFESALPPRR